MKIIILQILLFATCFSFVKAQTLNVPPRNPADQNGTQIIASITNLSLQNRETYILTEVMKGNIPNFYRNMIAINDSALIGSIYKHITYYVIPDYLALGTDTNYFLCPMTPILGQIIADTLNCTLPTRKMVNKIWSAAAVKMQPQTIPPSPQMTTVPIFTQHNTDVWIQRQTFFPSNPLGNLVGGDKKDVVISNLIYTSPPPKRVVIYGWHYPNGSNIQPLYAGHIDTYADYSHGIRLVQNEVYVDGVPMLATDVLMSATLNPLLSDEGVIAIPFYPNSSITPPPLPTIPKSFCIINETATSVRIKITNDSNVTNYKVYFSSDGLNFSTPNTYASNNFVVTGLPTNTISYFKIAASNTTGTSAPSEVLSATPSATVHNVLIVNGFDRASAGNTFNFIRQHGKAIFNYGYYFSSATNDAVINGLIALNTYAIADYILGEESTVDETFSTAEQTLVANFLDNGGYLFVSGAEIAWDLDFMGSTSDKNFYTNYLKASYVFDAPNNQSSTYYQFQTTVNSIFANLGNTFFDDGNNGTYNVAYPDVIDGINGGINGLKYTNLTNNNAGVYFKGLFPNASIDTGKVVNLGIPFETIYPASKRFALMKNVLDFFADIPNLPAAINQLNFKKINIYPNPVKAKITIDLGENTTKNTMLQIINNLGEVIFTTSISAAKTTLNFSNYAKGTYFIKLTKPTGSKVLKIIKA